jgi:hypothetical protein
MQIAEEDRSEVSDFQQYSPLWTVWFTRYSSSMESMAAGLFSNLFIDMNSSGQSLGLCLG